MAAPRYAPAQLGIPTFHHSEFPPDRLLAAKTGRSVSVILPARNEEATIGPIVASIVRTLMDTHGLVDETIVVDSASRDGTARVATEAGATVIQAGDLDPGLGPPLGKGDVLWRSLEAGKGDVIVWVDADIVDFDPRFVTGVLGPLLTDPGVQLSKGYYERPITETGGALSRTGGGRVTELVARPAVALLYPDLVGVVQPLSGEYAMRRDTAEGLPFSVGYGVEIGLLIDVYLSYGTAAIAQVDLDRRIHRNRPLAELGATALEVLHAILSRAGTCSPLAESFRRVDSSGTVDELPAHVGSRPPRSGDQRPL